MKTNQTMGLTVIIAAPGGRATYYILRNESQQVSKGDADWVNSASNLTLVNATTNIGVTAAVAERERN